VADLIMRQDARTPSLEMTEAEIQLAMHSVLLATMLGMGHPVMSAYIAAIKRHQLTCIKINIMVDRDVGSKL